MTFAVGDRPRANDLRTRLPIIGFAVDDATTVSTTSYVNCPGVGVYLFAGYRYALDAFIAYDTGTTPGIRFSLSAPSGAFGSWGLYGLANTGPSDNIEGIRRDTFGDATEAGTYGDATNGLYVMPHGTITIGERGGLVQFRFAQLVSTASATTVRAGSWLRAIRIA